MRRLLVVATGVAALGLGLGIPAQADQAAGTCPDNYQVVHTFKGDPVDKNGNRYICEQPVPSAIPNPGGQGATLVIDDKLAH
jgi:hypothetical protein